MLEIEFEFNNGRKTYHSPIKGITSNKNLLKGRSGKAKTLLLHILSLAFYGLDDNRISKKIRDEMRNILYQYVTWKITYHGNNGLILISEKKDAKKPNFMVTENGILLNSEDFRGMINMLYILPSDPIEKITIESIKEIENDHNIRATELEDVLQTIRDNLSEIDSRNPQRVERLRNSLKLEEEKRSSLQEEQKMLNEFYMLLRHAVYHKLEDEYNSKIGEEQKLLENLEQRANIDDDDRRRIEREYSSAKKKIDKKIEMLKPIFMNTYSLLKGIQGIPNFNIFYVQTWASTKIDDANTNHTVVNDIINLVSNISTKLNNVKDENEIKDQKIKGLTAFLRDAKTYKEVEIDICGVSMDKVIRDLENKLEPFNNFKEFNENIEKCIKNLNTINTDLHAVDNLWKTIINTNDDINKYISRISGEIMTVSLEDINKKECLQKKLESDIEKHEFYVNQISLLKNEPDYNPEKDYESIGEGYLKKYEGYDEDSLTKEIRIYEGRMARNRADIKMNDGDIRGHRDELVLSIVSDPDKDIMRLNKLNKWKSVYEHLYKKYNTEFKLYLQKIDGYAKTYPETRKEPNLPDGQSKYYDTIFSIIARKIYSVTCEDNERHDDIKSWNLITRHFTTKEGEIIPFSSISYGQGQSAYLCKALNTADYRQIIALFDDISNIGGDEAMNPIKEKIRELENKNRLLIAILVQARDGDLEVSPF